MTPDFGVSEEVRRRYLTLFGAFLREELAAERFADDFLTMWRRDRDSGTTTGFVIDQLMTGADCYTPSPNPEAPFEISEAQLRDEVSEAVAALSEGD